MADSPERAAVTPEKSSLTQIAVDRPVTTLMVAGIVVMLGWISLQRLAIDLMPDMSFPTLSIVTVYEGAGPEEVETLLTRPIEQAVSSVAGVDEIRSESMEGSSTVRVQFVWGTNLDEAVNEIRQQLDRIRKGLPDDIDPPYVRKFDTADAPILLMGLQSTLSGVELTSLAERVILPQLEQVDGVASVRLRGREVREIQIELDRGQMETRGIGVNEIFAALQSANVMQPAGDLQRGDTRILVRNRGEFRSLDEIRETVIRNQGGAFVRIADVATVIDGIKDKTELTRVNGQPALMVYVFKQAGANTVAVSDEVQQQVRQINRDVQDARLVIRQDRADFIREAISNIKYAAALGMLLATIVLVIFLRNFRSTLIIGVAMPFSVIATFVLIYFQGFTLNIVSFGGLALGIGLLVDNSIVVLESIFRYREQGYSPRDAAIQGTQEVAGAIVASTLTTLIVFLPLIFVEGMTGVLLHQLAWVVSFSLFCSLLASLTITPVMVAHWLKTNPTDIQTAGTRSPISAFHEFNRRWFEAVEAGYRSVLRFSLRHGFLVGGVMCVFVAAAAGLQPFVGTEFLPKADEGLLTVTMTMSPGITLDHLNEQAREAEARILENTPEYVSLAGFIGGDADDADRWNRIYYRLRLVPRDQRDASVEDIRNRLQEKLTGIPGCRLSVRVASEQLLSRAFQMGDGSLSVLAQGHDLATLQKLSEQVVETMQTIPGLVNAEVAKSDARPELGSYVNRPKASQLDVNVEEVGQVLETTLRGTEVTKFRQDGEEIPVVARFREADRRSERELEQVSVTSADGLIIPLKNLVDFEPGQAPITINRANQRRTLAATADISERELGEVAIELSEALRQIQLPRGYTLTVGGAWEDQQESFATLQQGFLVALILMYMVMASQFESLRDPLLILITIPLAGIGVMAVFAFTETTLNVQSFIGLIVLAGIVVNNAIVVIDYVNQLRRENPDWKMQDLVEAASVRRFRPIVMTTLTTILAMAPVAVGWGDGGELQAPMARVVIGGLVSGTMTTLFAIPLIYVTVGQLTQRTSDSPELLTAKQHEETRLASNPQPFQAKA